MSAATMNEMERLRKELEAAQAERDTLASRVDFLNQQNSALAAHVERLSCPVAGAEDDRRGCRPDL